MHVVVMMPDGHQDYETVFNGSVAGEQKDYPKRYHFIAFKKAGLSARTRMNTGHVLTKCPALLEQEDIIWQGGVYLDGIAVGASGGPAPLDEAVAMMVAVNIKAFLEMQVIKLQEAAKTGGPYVIDRQT